MENKNSQWLLMKQNIQLLHSFSRMIQIQKRPKNLTSNELEILSHIYISSDTNTPVHISLITGMKKEAVSRTVSKLLAKGLIQKNKLESDNRSFKLSITEDGMKELKKGYEVLMNPYYFLLRQMGDDFKDLIVKIEKANDLLHRYKEENP